jgi:hypothetical protein
VLVSLALLILGVAVGFMAGGLSAALLVVMLAVFELAMSFNNAVINATVLAKMNVFWRRMFMTAGFLVAVVGMRLFFPLAIVAVTARASLGRVVFLAVHDPKHYASLLTLAHPVIAAFGSTFLIMLFLDFVLDQTKRVHWLGVIERPMARAGRFRMLSVAICCVLIVAMGLSAGTGNRLRIVIAGLIGLGLYLGVRTFGRWCFAMGVSGASGHARRAGLAMFIYLEVLDASFSLDGVVGAFAITSSVIVIAVGLSVGAYFVRTLTLEMVKRNTLERFIYLEHGAQYSVGVLALLLAFSLIYNVPGLLVGVVGIIIIAASLASSLAAPEEAQKQVSIRPQ